MLLAGQRSGRGEEDGKDRVKGRRYVGVPNDPAQRIDVLEHDVPSALDGAGTDVSVGNRGVVSERARVQAEVGILAARDSCRLCPHGSATA